MDDIINEVTENSMDEFEEGASLVEYAILVALILVICIAAIRFVGTMTSTQFSTIGSQMS